MTSSWGGGEAGGTFRWAEQGLSGLSAREAAQPSSSFHSLLPSLSSFFPLIFFPLFKRFCYFYVFMEEQVTQLL